MNTATSNRRLHGAMAGLLFGIAVVLFALLAGCASGQTVEVGRVSLSFPDGFTVQNEKTNASVSLPEGMDAWAKTVANDDGSIAFVVAEVDDPNRGGLEAAKPVLEPIAKDPSEMSELELKVTEGTKDAQFSDAEVVELNGRNALTRTMTLKGVIVRDYYVEADGAVAAAISGIYPESAYNADPGFYDNIFASIKVK